MPNPNQDDFMGTLQYWFHNNCEGGEFYGDCILMSPNDFNTLYNSYNLERRNRRKENFPEPHLLYNGIPVISAPHVTDGSYYWDVGVSACEVCHNPIRIGREYAKLKRFGHDIWVCASCVSLAQSHLTTLNHI